MQIQYFLRIFSISTKCIKQKLFEEYCLLVFFLLNSLILLTANTNIKQSRKKILPSNNREDERELHLILSSAGSDEWGLSISPQFLVSAHYAMLVFPKEIMQCDSSTYKNAHPALNTDHVHFI